MILREARASDAAAVRTIWNAVIRDTLATFTTELLTHDAAESRIARRQGAFWVAEDAPGAVVGFATFGPFRSGPGYAATVEHTIILTPEARGRGTGHLLMNMAEQAARDNGHHVMVAAISGANLRAVDFHAKRGFVEVGRLPEVGRKAGRWLDLILMQKTVSAS